MNGCRRFILDEACGGDTECRDGLCAALCVDEPCMGNQKRCDGNAVMTCREDAAGCREWGPAVACGAGLVCDAGACRAACSDECPTASGTMCSGNAVRTCGNYDADACREWGTAIPCDADERCEAGACVERCPDEPCVDGDKLCEGNDVVLCVENDQGCFDWGPPSACDAGFICDEGDCLGTCIDTCPVLDETACSGNAVIGCGYHDTDSCREWSAPVACEANEVCDAGECIASVPIGTLLINEIVPRNYSGETAGPIFEPFSFVELYGKPGTALKGVTLVTVDHLGVESAPMAISGVVPADGYFVIASYDSYTEIRSFIDFPVAPKMLRGPGSLQLRSGSTVLDAIAYGDFRDGDVIAGEGTPAGQPGLGHALGRDSARSDSDDNARDFVARVPTPGGPNGAAKRAPLPRLTCPTDVVVGVPVTLDGSASTDPDGVATWTFYLGDGSAIAGTAKSVQATWTTAGTYVLRLVGSAPGYTIRPMWQQATCSVLVKAAAYTPTWRQLSAGDEHTCAIHRDGTLWCWGDNVAGRVQPANPVGKILTPSKVSTDSDWTWVASGEQAYAIRGGGLRRLDTINQEFASAANSGAPWRDWVMVSAGMRHSCGVRANNTIWCWGANEYGQLGNGSTTATTQPVQVSSNSVPTMGWSSVVVGNTFTCATRLTGELYCWGNGFYLGAGEDYADINSRPTLISNDTQWASLEAGQEHMCAIKRGKTLWCWGNSDHGQTAHYVFTDHAYTPELVVSGGPRWLTVSAGWTVGCGLMDDGTLWCWGASTFGQRGDGLFGFEDAEDPEQVLAADASPDGEVWSDWGALYPVTSSHTCAERLDGTLWCWGAGGRGQRGDGTDGVSRGTPAAVVFP